MGSIESLISLTNQQTKQPAIAAQGSQDQTETTLPKRVYKTSSKKKLYKLKITKGILHKLQRTIFKIEFLFFTFLPQATRPSLSRHSVTMNSARTSIHASKKIWYTASCQAILQVTNTTSFKQSLALYNWRNKEKGNFWLNLPGKGVYYKPVVEPGFCVWGPTRK